MLALPIPGFKTLALEHLVLDFNGTLAVDGKLLAGVFERLRSLAAHLAIQVVTADTFGHAREALEGLPARLTVLEPGRQAQAKQALVQALGPDRVAAIGNGRNDRLMLQTAALGIAVTSLEGTAVEALVAAHLFVPSIREALDLLNAPLRLVATLRA
jgi:soluble P-type ATPase